MVRTTSTLLALLALLPDLGSAQRPAKPAGLTVYLTGNAADSGRQTVDGPAAILMGGSREVDEAFSAYAFPIVNGGDIVVLRTSGSDGYNDYFYEELVTGPLQPDSVETILLTSRSFADSDYAAWVIDTAEMVWFAGGDQSTYTGNWRGTETEAALQRAWDRGAVLGGTSAGLAILGEFIFDPGEARATDSEDAIANPYNSGLTITDRLIDIPWLDNFITDTHFAQRDRMGRSLAFMARLREDGRANTIYGIGVDERTAVFIDKDGRGTVLGQNHAYVMSETPQTQRTQVAPGQPLVYTAISRLRLEAGDTYNFATRTAPGRPLEISIDGRTTPPSDPADLYGPNPDLQASIRLKM